MVEAVPMIMIFAGIAVFGIIAVPPMLHNVDTGANIIEQLFDVNSTNSTNNDILVFDSVSGLWDSVDIEQFLTNQTKGHLNVGGGAEVFKDENSTDARFRTIIGSGGIGVVQNENTISIITGAGGGPPALAAIAKDNATNVVYNATSDGPLLTIVGDGISITNSSSILFSLNATVGRLNDVFTENLDENQLLFFNITSGNFENEPVSSLIGLKDTTFPAEESTVDDLTGVDCVNAIVYDFFDNIDVNEYRRDVVEFCANSDTDDNITWLYIVPKFYSTDKNFNFRLLWSDDNSAAGAFMQNTANDCEESIGPLGPAGDVTCTSTDIELHAENIVEADDNDISAYRYTGVTIPQGATILDARIQYHVDQTNPDVPIVVVFHGEDVDDSAVLTSANFDISSRTNTTASVSWSVPDWVSVSDEGAAQLTPDLSSIVQEIVDRLGWVSGNDMTIMLNDWVDCTATSCPVNFGKRHAEAAEGEAANSPELIVSFSTGAAGPVCFEFSLMAVQTTELLDGAFTARDTQCINRSGLDQLSITEFTVNATDHQFTAEDLVFLRIHRPNDFVVNDFEGDVYVLSGELQWLN